MLSVPIVFHSGKGQQMPYTLKKVSEHKAHELIALTESDEVKVRVGDKIYDIPCLGALLTEDKSRVECDASICDEEYDWDSDPYTPVVLYLPLDQKVDLVEIEWRAPRTWHDHLPNAVRLGRAPMTEEDVWQAIADHKGVDVNEIADGDLIEHI